MKGKYFFFVGCACLLCLVIGMIAGALVSQRHLNFWFPADERAEVCAAIEKARRMMAELEEIQKTIDALNIEAEKSITWNQMKLRVRPSDGD
jgi:type II secretory pathway component PulM